MFNWLRSSGVQLFCITIFILYLGYASTLVQNDTFTSIVFLFLLIIFLVKGHRFDPVLFYTLLVWLAINLASAFIINTKQHLSFISLIGVTLRIVIPYLIIKIIGIQFFEKVIRYVYVLSIIGLVLFSIQVLYPDLFFTFSDRLNFMTQSEQHGRIAKLSSELYHYIIKHHSLFGIKSFLFFMLPKSIRTKARVNEKGYLNSDFVSKYKTSNSIAGNLYGSKNLTNALLDHFEYKLDHLLKWEDRNSMWFSLESRVPFLDYRLVEKTLATSSNWKIRKGMTKYILREAMKGILPEKIRLRLDKIGFSTPQDEWFREPVWQSIVTEVLDSDSFRSRNLISVGIAKDLYQNHLLGKVNISKEIWKWIHLEMWFREFID